TYDRQMVGASEEQLPLFISSNNQLTQTNAASVGAGLTDCDRSAATARPAAGDGSGSQRPADVGDAPDDVRTRVVVSEITDKPCPPALLPHPFTKQVLRRCQVVLNRPLAAGVAGGLECAYNGNVAELGRQGVAGEPFVDRPSLGGASPLSTRATWLQRPQAHTD
ncbi:hypothetical protein EVAR_51403_1, partial [Eumeta japonica]